MERFSDLTISRTTKLLITLAPNMSENVFVLRKFQRHIILPFNSCSFWLCVVKLCVHKKTIKLYYVDWPTEASSDYPAPDKESISLAMVISTLASSNTFNTWGSAPPTFCSRYFRILCFGGAFDELMERFGDKVFSKISFKEYIYFYGIFSLDPQHTYHKTREPTLLQLLWCSLPSDVQI